MEAPRDAHAVLQKLSIAGWLRAHGKFVRPELTKKQRQELKECFELIDADGSGAIDASEMLTAFNVLGMHVKKSEVEAMLAEVDADGSGEVEYPEFVQIMTTKLDRQQPDASPSRADGKSGKQQTLPFPLLAQAYRRKKLMEAVMGGDKATQERLQARADAAEAERRAMLDEAANQKQAIKKIQQKTLTSVASQRIRRAAKLKQNEFKKLHVTESPLPSYVIEHMDSDVKKVLYNIHERASVRRTSMAGERDKATTNSKSDIAPIPEKSEEKPTTSSEDKVDEVSVSPENLKEVIKTVKAMPNSAYPPPRIANTAYKEDFKKLVAFRSMVRHKPTLEQQLLHVHAIKSLHDYFEEGHWEIKGSPLQYAASQHATSISITAASLEDRPSSTSFGKLRPRPMSSLGELCRPRWI